MKKDAFYNFHISIHIRYPSFNFLITVHSLCSRLVSSVPPYGVSCCSLFVALQLSAGSLSHAHSSLASCSEVLSERQLTRKPPIWIFPSQKLTSTATSSASLLDPPSTTPLSRLSQGEYLQSRLLDERNARPTFTFASRRPRLPPITRLSHSLFLRKKGVRRKLHVGPRSPITNLPPLRYCHRHVDQLLARRIYSSAEYYVVLKKIYRCDTLGSNRSASEVRWLTEGSSTLAVCKAQGQRAKTFAIHIRDDEQRYHGWDECHGWSRWWWDAHGYE